MAVPYKNVSQVKSAIKQIVNNLQQLEHHDCTELDLQELKTNTEDLLSELENFPLEHLKTKLKKRQRKRLNKNLQKLKNLQSSKTPDKVTDSQTAIEKITSTASGELTLKTFHQITSIKECQRILQTFELLEQLHLLRGQNSSETYKFSLKLRQVKSIWNCLLQDKLQEQTSTDVRIQREWNEVFFGPSEKTYFQDKPDLQDFIRKRQIWDSYIDSKYGSSIPIGWVTPPVKVKEQWLPYLAKTNI